MLKVVSGLLTIIFLFAHRPVLAEELVFSSIESLTFQLIDLDPLDGIDPEITFYNSTSSASSCNTSSCVGSGAVEGMFQPASIEVVDAGRTYRADVTSDRAVASIFVPLDLPRTGFFPSRGVYAGVGTHFELSPATDLIITAQFGGVRSFGGGLIPGFDVDWTNTELQISSDANEYFTIPGRDNVSYTWLQEYDGLYGYIGAQAAIRLVALPVPEPASSSMILAGAIVLFGVVRRARVAAGGARAA
jgi:hypothetical protein